MTPAAASRKGVAVGQGVEKDLAMVRGLAPRGAWVIRDPATPLVGDHAEVVMTGGAVLGRRTETPQVVAVAGLADIRIGRTLYEGLHEELATVIPKPFTGHPVLCRRDVGGFQMWIVDMARIARHRRDAGEPDGAESGPKVDVALGACACEILGTAQESGRMPASQRRRRKVVHPPVRGGVLDVGISGMAGDAGDERVPAFVVRAMAGVATIGRCRKSCRLLFHEFLTMEEHPVCDRRYRTGPTVGLIIGIATLARGDHRFRLLHHPCRRMGKLGVATAARNAAGAAQEVRPVTGLAGVAVRRTERTRPMSGC